LPLSEQHRTIRAVDYSHVFDLRRWRQRFRGEQGIAQDARDAGRVPDATTDEVGAAPDPVGFAGRPRRGSGPGNGQGSGDPRSGGWAGWGAS
jgi:hypothetical protein